MEYGRGPVREGQRVLLIDEKKRRYHLVLRTDKVFNTHLGRIPHAVIIGCDEGTRLRTSEGAEFILLRPATSDFVVKMGRPTNILYPKDLGLITAFAGIGAGSRIVEAGTGSGSGAIALLRATGPTGHVTSYELREEFTPRARENITGAFGELPPWLDLKPGDVCALSERGLDAIVLDLPEPWLVVPAAIAALRPGGFLVAFLPTTVQLQQHVIAIEESRRFTQVESLESLVRPWDVSARSVRPAHRMTGHTGFLTFARLCQPPIQPNRQRPAERQEA